MSNAEVVFKLQTCPDETNSSQLLATTSAPLLVLANDNGIATVVGQLLARAQATVTVWAHPSRPNSLREPYVLLIANPRWSHRVRRRMISSMRAVVSTLSPLPVEPSSQTVPLVGELELIIEWQ